MSLFKARYWWLAQCGAGEEFDGNCLCVANVDNDPDESVKIITGSLQGMLRIYMPRQRDYRPEDLLYEQELDAAILQVAVGRFSTAGGLQLAVLHPRKLVVFNCQNMGAQYLQVTPLYEHAMDHTAANMCYGGFGGQKGCDHICVQSYDGQLSFFECELFAFARYLPGFLVPGPLAYVEASDQILTCNASLELEAFKYKSLAAASGDKQEPASSSSQPPTPQKQGMGGGGNSILGNAVSLVSAPSGGVAGMSAGKRVAADWRIILGEAAVDIQAGRLSANLQSYQADIVVLCEHHVFIVSSQSGQVVFQKRLEYHPACATLYAAPGAKLPGGADNLLVATHSKSLAVYRANILCWAARLDHQPVAVRVATLGSPAQRGMIVTLDDTGQLVVSYLGTDPIINPVGWAEGQQLDYESMAREQKSLAAIIRDHAQGRRMAPADALIIRPQIPSVMDSFRAGMGGGGARELSSIGSRSRQTLSGRVLLSYQGGASAAEAVQVCFRAPEPLGLQQESLLVPYVPSDPSAPAVVTLQLSPASDAHLPWSNMLTVTANYLTTDNQPRAQNLDVQLPLCLFATLVPPVKSAAYKVTVSTNKAAPQLSALFEDMMAQAAPATVNAYSSAGANVMSFQLSTGAECTILVSKNTGRYRLQSDCLEAMWLILSELIRRLEAYYQAVDSETSAGGNQGGEGVLQWSSDEPLPLQDVIEVVEQHWGCRLRIRELKQALEHRASALRAIEKRLLIRFKDKNPAPLCQLDVLLEDTYAALIDTAEKLEEAQARLRTVGMQLAAVLQLLVLLVRVKFQLGAEDCAVLHAALCVSVPDIDQGCGGGEVGWEEMVEASCTHLLRTSLARNSKEQAVTLGPLAPGQDTSKLTKLMTLVLERLSKGMTLTGPGTLASQKSMT